MGLRFNFSAAATFAGLVIAVILTLGSGCAGGGTAGTGLDSVNVRGLVLNDAAEPVANLKVSVVNSEQVVLSSAETGETGEFEVHLPPTGFLVFELPGSSSNTFAGSALPANAHAVSVLFEFKRSENSIEAKQVTVTEYATPTPSPRPDPTATASPSQTATPTPLGTPTATPTQFSATPSSTATPVSTPTPMGTATPTPPSCPPPGLPIGDMNCDGSVNVNDTDPFTMALLNPQTYASQYPGCNALNGDVNGDGRLDNFDIDCFVALSTGAPLPYPLCCQA